MAPISKEAGCDKSGRGRRATGWNHAIIFLETPREASPMTTEPRIVAPISIEAGYDRSGRTSPLTYRNDLIHFCVRAPPAPRSTAFGLRRSKLPYGWKLVTTKAVALWRHTASLDGAALRWWRRPCACSSRRAPRRLRCRRFRASRAEARASTSRGTGSGWGSRGGEEAVKFFEAGSHGSTTTPIILALSRTRSSSDTSAARGEATRTRSSDAR